MKPNITIPMNSHKELNNLWSEEYHLLKKRTMHHSFIRDSDAIQLYDIQDF